MRKILLIIIICITAVIGILAYKQTTINQDYNEEILEESNEEDCELYEIIR